MSRFSVEPDHFCRAFSAAWPGVGLSALDLADICQKLLRRLVQINPAYGEVGFGYNPHLLPPADRLKILDMSVQDLAGVIDRNRRIDQPKFPSPIGRSGFHIIMGANNMSSTDPRMIGFSLKGGSYRTGDWDALEISLCNDSPVWKDPDLALGLIDDLIEITACHCAVAWAYILGEPWGHWRPWMNWLADHAGSPLPEPFQPTFERPPNQVSRHKSGVLQVWD